MFSCRCLPIVGLRLLLFLVLSFALLVYRFIAFTNVRPLSDTVLHDDIFHGFASSFTSSFILFLVFSGLYRHALDLIFGFGRGLWLNLLFLSRSFPFA